MNDFTAIAVFAACVLVTFGLIRACEWLMPREPERPGAADLKEARK